MFNFIASPIHMVLSDSYSMTTSHVMDSKKRSVKNKNHNLKETKLDLIEEVHQVCYKVYFRSFLPRPSRKTYLFLLTVSSVDNRLFQSCVDVIADTDPLLERETW